MPRVESFSLFLPESMMALTLTSTTSNGKFLQKTVRNIVLDTTCSRKFSKPSAELKQFPNSRFLRFLPTKSTFQKSPFKFLTKPSAISSSPGAETSSSYNFESTTEGLDSVVVFDLNGKEIPICDLWKNRKAVVAFARHFGCVLCRKRADYLANEKEKMDTAGVALVLIGPGSVDQVYNATSRYIVFFMKMSNYGFHNENICVPTASYPFQAKSFSEQTQFKGEVYADPSYSSYQALKFVSGVSTTITSGAGLKIIQAYLEGYRQDWALSFEKDTRTRGGWQQGGIIVAGPGKNKISYIHKDKEAGDDPNIQNILKACCLQDG